MPFGQNNDEPTIFVIMIKLIVSWVGIILSILIVVVLVVWGFSLNVSDNAEIPVVKASVKEYRIIPDEPGGQIVNYQGLSVYSVQEKGSAQIAANEIRLAPDPINLSEKKNIVEQLLSSDEQGNNQLDLSEKNQGDANNISSNNSDTKLRIFISVRPVAKNYIKLETPTIIKEFPPREIEIEEIEKVEKIVLKPGAFYVELGSYRTKDKAKKTWSSLSKGNSLIFKNKEQLIQDVSTNSSKLFKLRVVGFVNIIESRVFCDQLRDWGTICLPMRAE